MDAAVISDVFEDEPVRPKFDADEAAKMVGLSSFQKKFAMALLRGANQTQAARVAGYSPGNSEDGFKSAGHRAAQSEKVKAFLEWAKQEGAGVPEVAGDSAELRRILWRHARGADKAYSIRAAEVINRMNREDMERRSDAAPGVLEALNQIALLNASIAMHLAKKYGVAWDPAPDVLRKLHHRCPTCGGTLMSATAGGQHHA